MPERFDTIWHDQKTDILRTLWLRGVSTTEIAMRLQVTKNAVIGKAHRLHLPARASPIKRGSTTRPKVPKRPPNASFTPPVAAQALPPLRLSVAETLPSPAQGPAHGRCTHSRCTWPIGEVRTPSFRYCDAPALAGKPYCPEHYQIAYRKAPRPGSRTISAETSTEIVDLSGLTTGGTAAIIADIATGALKTGRTGMGE